MMEQKKIGIAIIGAGAIADVHIKAYAQYPDLCEVRAVCDLFPEKAEQLIQANGLAAAKAYKDCREAIVSGGIDAVSICLPPQMHAEIAVEALHSGCHVICEKPMACSLEECDAMIAAAKESGKILSVVVQNRCKTPNQKVKKILDEGLIGKVLFATVDSLWWRGQSYYDLWWRGTWDKESSGAMASHGVHHIDLMQWMLGMPESVYAVIRNVGHDNSECEDLGVAILNYPDKLVRLTTSIVNHDEAQEIQFNGEKASIAVPWKVASNTSMVNGFPEENSEEEAKLQKYYDELPDLEREGHPAQLLNFLRAIRGEEALFVDGTEGRKTIELITAIYKSANTGTTVTLPIACDDVYYQRGGFAKVMPHFHEKHRSVENFVGAKPITLGRDVGK